MTESRRNLALYAIGFLGGSLSVIAIVKIYDDLLARRIMKSRKNLTENRVMYFKKNDTHTNM